MVYLPVPLSIAAIASLLHIPVDVSDIVGRMSLVLLSSGGDRSREERVMRIASCCEFVIDVLARGPNDCQARNDPKNLKNTKDRCKDRNDPFLDGPLNHSNLANSPPSHNRTYATFIRWTCISLMLFFQAPSPFLLYRSTHVCTGHHVSRRRSSRT